MDFTEEEQTQLISVCKELGSKPKFDSKQDFIDWMKSYIASQGDSPSEDAKPPQKSEVTQPQMSQPSKEVLPRIPVFSGATLSKADHASFEVWNDEIKCLIKEKRYTPESILHAARLSLRSEASRVAVRLGTEVTIEQLIDKMRHLYGTVEAGEDLLANFYSAAQKDDETVVQWSCRLEDLLEEAIQADKFNRKDSQIALKNKFWNGLRRPLRELSGYKFDQNLSYEDFMVEVRKIERSHAPDLPKASKPSKPSGRVHAQQTATLPLDPLTKETSTLDQTSPLQQLQAQVNSMAQQLNQLYSHVSRGRPHQTSARPVPRSTAAHTPGVTRPLLLAGNVTKLVTSKDIASRKDS